MKPAAIRLVPVLALTVLAAAACSRSASTSV